MADIDAGSVTYNLPQPGSVKQTVYADVKKIMTVAEFGAIPDGVTDSTVAINNAISAAYQYKQDLHFNAGPAPYVTRGIVLGGGAEKCCRLIGDNWDPLGRSYPGAGLLLANGATGSLITVLAGGARQGHHTIERLSLYGNASNVSPTAAFSAIVQCPDYSGPDQYSNGVIIRDCYMQDSKHSAVYIGMRRQSVIESVNIYKSGTRSGDDHGLYINTYDIYIRMVNIYGSAGYGIMLADNVQNFNATQCQLYNNLGGIFLSKNANEVQWLGGSIDRNLRDGIVAYSISGSPYPGGLRTFVGMRMGNNGNSGDNLHSDIVCQEAVENLVFTNCMFQGSVDYPGKRSKNIVQFNNLSASVRMIGCNFAASKYAGGLTNYNPSVLQTACRSF